MATLRQAMHEFFAVPTLGPKESAGFPAQVQAIRQQSQRYFWTCVVLMIVQFTVLLVAGSLAICGVAGARPEWVSVAFGGTAATTLGVMMRFGREQIRADFLLAAMEELQASDPRAFTELVQSLARKWYKLE